MFASPWTNLPAHTSGGWNLKSDQISQIQESNEVKEAKTQEDVIKYMKDLIPFNIRDMEYLELYGIHLTPSSSKLFATALKSTNSITALNAQRHLDSHGCKVLVDVLMEHNSVKSLNIAYNHMNVFDCVAWGHVLKLNHALTDLNMSFINLGPNGCESIGSSLRTNSTLRTLDLSGNNLGEAGCLALAEALKINQTLTSLDLSRCSIQARECQVLCSALEVNQGLRQVNLRYNEIGVGSWILIANVLKINNTLVSLNLKGNAMGHNGDLIAAALAVNSTLTSLDISSCGFGFDEDCDTLSAALLRNKSLTQLKLDNNIITKSPIVFDALKANDCLQALSIKSILINPEGVESLCEALAVNRTLTELDMGSNRIAVHSLRELVTKPLKSIKLHKCISKVEEIEVLCGAISQSSTIETLSLAKCTLSLDCCRILGALLKTNRTVTALNLRLCTISQAGYELICNGLRHNSTLTNLAVGRHPIDIASCRAIGHMLKHNQTITSLELASYIDPSKAEALYDSGLNLNESLVRVTSSNSSGAIKFSGLHKRLEQNKVTQQQIIHNSLRNIRLIARTKEIYEQLPVEMWLLIFKHIKSPGVALNFEKIGLEILCDFNSYK